MIDFHNLTQQCAADDRDLDISSSSEKDLHQQADARRSVGCFSVPSEVSLLTSTELDVQFELLDLGY